MASAEDSEPVMAEPNRQEDVAAPYLAATAETPSSPGHPGGGSGEEAGEELERLTTQLDELHCDGGTTGSSTTGHPGEEGGEEEGDGIERKRQQGDGEESVASSGIAHKELDYDQDKRSPQYIPRRSDFFQHDDRMVGDEEAAEVPEEKKEDEKGSQKNKKLWQDEAAWTHDMFVAEEQGPKTEEELVATYGYDIRSEASPPPARGQRRYGRGPNKYQRNWEGASSARPGFGRGGGTRGGLRGRGGSDHVGNPSFRDEDFPDLNTTPASKADVREGGHGADSKSTAAPTTEPFRSGETRAKPKRYSSLRQRPVEKAASSTQEPGAVAPETPSVQVSPGPNPPQPAILMPAHFQGPNGHSD